MLDKLKRAKKIPTQARSQATVLTILNTAKQIIVNEGVHCLTTNKIAEQSGVTVGSIYQYFEDKEAIIYEIFSAWLDSYFAVYKSYSNEANNQKKAVEDFFLGVLSLFVADHNDSKSMLRQLEIAIQTDPEIEALDKQHTERFCQAIFADCLRLDMVEDTEADRQKVRFGFVVLLQVIDVINQADSTDREAYIGYTQSMLQMWLRSFDTNK
ncbi:TetR/AcrR family transcriptional regulator [Psychrobacter sp. I-STPA6b]|uniref:TetR/AcrR family transcriptional regulator n=1 Tax=Psychrobacter sp. I-STPA6b TaxID=2585718 RepID=UPI001D0C6B1F|nr:TetR/AcrR family transcriptional regulator [Psychrobacter sp. I-STPA6b]